MAMTASITPHPVQIRSAAAIAGPINQAALSVAEPSAIAAAMSCFVTNASTSAICAGVVSNLSGPVKRVETNNRSRVIAPTIAMMANTAIIAVAVWVRKLMRI